MGHQHKLITFKINSTNSGIELVDELPKDAPSNQPEASMQATEWDDMWQEYFPSGEARFGVVDFAYEHKERLTSKIVLVKWVPDDAPPRQKMLYASTFENFKGKLDGVHKVIQATDDQTMSASEVVDKCKRV